ncbi:MAG: metal ABC transporter substrate-binding protein [Candidatus Thermoplasmatota archaeon]
MKKSFDLSKKAILLTITLSILIIPQTQATAETQDEQITIVCTNTILADFTKNIAPKNDIKINYIMPAGVCPAHFDTTPSDVSKIIDADVIVSLGWEPWLSKLLKKSENEDYKEIKCTGIGEWNLPSNAIKYVENISRGLKEIYPQYNSTISSKTKKYISEINKTADQLKKMIECFNYEGKKVICMQWQKDFVEWLGLDVVDSYLPPEKLSADDKINITDTAKKENIVLVVDNLQSGTDFGATLSKDVNAEQAILTNFPGAKPNTTNYTDMIKYNTVQLIKGITIQDEKNINKEENIKSVQLQRNISLIFMIIFLLLSIVFFIMYKKK